jgi:hypothetical protein
VTIPAAKWPRNRGSISDSSKWFLSPSQHPDRFWSQLSLLFGAYLGSALPRGNILKPSGYYMYHQV